MLTISVEQKGAVVSVDFTAPTTQAADWMGLLGCVRAVIEQAMISMEENCDPDERIPADALGAVIAAGGAKAK